MDGYAKGGPMLALPVHGWLGGVGRWMGEP